MVRGVKPFGHPFICMTFRYNSFVVTPILISLTLGLLIALSVLIVDSIRTSSKSSNGLDWVPTMNFFQSTQRSPESKCQRWLIGPSSTSTPPSLQCFPQSLQHTRFKGCTSFYSFHKYGPFHRRSTFRSLCRRLSANCARVLPLTAPGAMALSSYLNQCHVSVSVMTIQVYV